MAQPCTNSSIITACVTCCPESFKNKYELIQWLDGRWWHKCCSRPVNWWSLLKPHANKGRACNGFQLLPYCQADISPCFVKGLFLKLCHPLSSLGSTKLFVCSSSSFGIVISLKHPTEDILHAHIFLLPYLIHREPLVNLLPYFIPEGVVTPWSWHKPTSRSLSNLVLVPMNVIPGIATP